MRGILRDLEEPGPLDSRFVTEPVATGPRDPEVLGPLAHDCGEGSGVGEAFEGGPDGVGALFERAGNHFGRLAGVLLDVGGHLGVEGVFVGALHVEERISSVSASNTAGVRRKPATLFPFAST